MKNKGFTLLELLVVMSLLALVMVSMGSALRSMAQTETKIDAKLARNDQMRVTAQFLQQALSRVSLGRSTNQATEKASNNQFHAGVDVIDWVGIMPARVGMGGRHFFRLSAEDTAEGRVLVLRFTPWSSDVQPIWGQQGDKRVLIENLTHFSVESRGLPTSLESITADWPRDWVKGWPMGNELPQFIRLNLADQQGNWSPIVVQLIPVAQGQSGSGGFTTGGT